MLNPWMLSAVSVFVEYERMIVRSMRFWMNVV